MPKSSLAIRDTTDKTFPSCQHLQCGIDTRLLRVITIYRPPFFFTKWIFSVHILGVLMYDGESGFKAWETNYNRRFLPHDENKDNADAARLIDILYSLYFQVHVQEPTHRKGHMLDLVISREDDTVVNNCTLSDAGSSDHLCVFL